MLSKCANPACSQPFRYLRDGKLFEIETNARADSSTAGERKPIRRVEFFWLCGQCCMELTVVHDKTQGVITIPLPGRPAAKRAASS
jgi:hypothetical protein